jgi:hypothetical protein
MASAVPSWPVRQAPDRAGPPLSTAAQHHPPAPPGRRRDVPSSRTLPHPATRSRTAITPLLDRSPPPPQATTPALLHHRTRRAELSLHLCKLTRRRSSRLIA